MTSLVIVALGVAAWLGVIVIAVSMCIMAATGDRAMQHELGPFEPAGDPPMPRSPGGRFRAAAFDWTVDDVATDG